jgi:hypothetical protein
VQPLVVRCAVPAGQSFQILRWWLCADAHNRN